MSSFDYDAFVKDKAYADTYTKSVQKSVLDFANHTNGAVTAYLRYNPKYSNPTSGVFAQRPSLDQNLECLTPTDFSVYDDLEQTVLGDYENFAKMGQQYHMDANTFRDIMQETKNAVEELEKHIGQIKKKMEKAAAELNFEAAAEYRDRLIELKNMLRDM